MESGAILFYLAEKTGRFLPSAGAERFKVLEWLMWQMGGIGPMLGQAHHFLHYNKGKAPYAEERFGKEAQRLYGVLDRQLTGADYVAGDYSIADMAIWPWIARFEWQEVDLGNFPNVKRWYTSIAARPAVQKGYHVPKFTADIPMP
jgi:GST-like protein